MLDWIGSLRLREKSARRVVLGLSGTTRVLGALLFAAGAYLVVIAWPRGLWVAALPGAIALFGAVLATLRRELVFDKSDGVLRIDQRVMGIANRQVVPLFHLRAVVIIARPAESSPIAALAPSRYVAYVDKRVGEAIYLDEARRCARLLAMAEAIADIADLRLEYDAMSQASGE